MQQETSNGSPTTTIPPPSYDDRAPTYDRRVGWPEPECRNIARTVLQISALEAEEILLEIGAGTGHIGEWLARSPARYVGFDLSSEMLSIFERRMKKPLPEGVKLVRADGNRTWPVADASVRAAFSSRAIHLLDRDRVLAELERVKSPAGMTLLLGRVRRQADSIPTQIKQHMHDLLEQHGLHPRKGQQRQQELLAALRRRGGRTIEPVAVATRAIASTPHQAITTWQQQRGLGGLDLPDDLKLEILQMLQAWAAETFEGVHHAATAVETYTLEGVRL